jgi:uncharacterized protein YneF (UPF0154 family)
VNIAITAIVALVALVLGLAAGYFYRKNAMEKKIGQTEEYARNLLDEAARKAEDKKKEAVLEAMATYEAYYARMKEMIATNNFDAFEQEFARGKSLVEEWRSTLKIKKS